jgi:predicted nucleic acid-binding protein
MMHARKIAKRLNIKQIGTIGLLLRAKRRGLIKSIKQHIDALVENGIHIRKDLVVAILKEAGE